MTRDEIRRRDNVFPTFLVERTWLDGAAGGRAAGGTWARSAA
jgi:hypothetical protein